MKNYFKKEKKQTKLIRVPLKFAKTTEKLTKKYGYNQMTDFLEYDGTKVFENADTINDSFGLFWKIKRKNVQKK